MQIVSKVIHTIREKIHILSTTTNINQKKIQMPRLPPSASNFPENSNCSKVKTQNVKKKKNTNTNLEISQMKIANKRIENIILTQYQINVPMSPYMHRYT